MTRALLIAVSLLAGCATVEVKAEAPPPTIPVQEVTVASQDSRSAASWHVAM